MICEGSKADGRLQQVVKLMLGRLMDKLSEFIRTNPDARELKRALAVQMAIETYPYYKIRDVLKVSVGFISKWKQSYEQRGVAGLHLRHKRVFEKYPIRPSA